MRESERRMRISAAYWLANVNVMPIRSARDECVFNPKPATHNHPQSATDTNNVLPLTSVSYREIRTSVDPQGTLSLRRPIRQLPEVEPPLANLP